jgi:ferredoxin, 2Fe-2S
MMITIIFIADNDQPERTRGTIGAISTDTGQSLMHAAVAANVRGIDADCGGLLSCGTCHVYVREPHASQLPPPDGEEISMLDFTASPRQPNSRLSCQIHLTDALDGLTVDLPPSQS